MIHALRLAVKVQHLFVKVYINNVIKIFCQFVLLNRAQLDIYFILVSNALYFSIRYNDPASRKAGIWFGRQFEVDLQPQYHRRLPDPAAIEKESSHPATTNRRHGLCGELHGVPRSSLVSIRRRQCGGSEHNIGVRNGKRSICNQYSWTKILQF